MAMSLADELAGFDDPPVEMGGGLSLAEEFGLENGYQDDPLIRDLSGEGSSMEERIYRDPEKDEELMSADHHLGGSYHGDAQIQASLPRPVLHPQSNGYRTAKSSSSTMYGTTTTSSLHDGTDVDAMLDSTLGDTSYETALDDMDGVLPIPITGSLSPQREKHRVDREGQSGVSESTGFLGHRVGKDPLQVLKDILDSNQPFLESLMHIDEPGSLRTPTQGRAFASESIEKRLQRHLERLQEEDRKREEQCRELTGLAREVLGYRWDGEIELEMATGKGLGLGMIHEEEEKVEGEEGEEDVGWSGDPRGVKVRPHFAEMVGRPRLDSPELELVDPIRRGALGSDPVSPLSPLRTMTPLPNDSSLETGLSSLAPLQKTLRLLKSTTPDLLATLTNLSDTIHSTTSFSNSSSRNLRGIRAGIDSWKDRDAQEEQARRGVEEFERKRLEAGLKGDQDGHSVKSILEREVKGFEGVLSGLQGRMDRLQRESAMRLALR